MSERTDISEKQNYRSRPWYRLHVSTCILLLLLTAVLVILIVPGDYRSLASPSNLDEQLGSRPAFVHGWPLVYSWRSNPLGLGPEEGGFAHEDEWTGIPWLDAEAWAPTNTVEEFWPGHLAVDILVALLMLVVVGAAFEWRRRRRQNVWQFSLRELLVAFVVIAGILAWWQTHRRRYQSELQAINAIYGTDENRSPFLSLEEYTRRPPKPVVLTYCGPKWLRKLVPGQYLGVFLTVETVGWHGGCSSADLERLRDHVESLPNLRGVYLHEFGGSVKTDFSLRHLVGLSTLRRLLISIDPVTDEELSHVAQLTQLQELGLWTSIDDEGLKHLAGMEKLRKLSLDAAPVSDSGIAHLGQLSNLEVLELGGTDVTDAGLLHLAQLPNLEEIDLSRTELTDAGLLYLSQLPNLKNVNLIATGVTDAGLLHLHELGNLRLIWLQDTAVTSEGVEQLQRAFPNCRIEFEWPD